MSQIANICRVTLVLGLFLLTGVSLGCAGIKHKRDPDADRVVEHFEKNMEPAKQCARAEMKTGVSPKGRITIRWTVNGKGEVEKPEVIEDTLGNPAVEQCWLRQVQATEFHKLGPFRRVTVTYTYEYL